MDDDDTTAAIHAGARAFADNRTSVGVVPGSTDCPEFDR